jgi:hypothetical protein
MTAWAAIEYKCYNSVNEIFFLKNLDKVDSIVIIAQINHFDLFSR